MTTQIQPLDLTQIIVAIISFTGVIYSVHKGRRQGSKPLPPKRKISKWTIGMSISLILLVANLGVLGWRYLEPTSEIEATEVKITYPYNDATVEIKEMLRGTSQKISEEQEIWVVIYPHEMGSYYPQNDPADIQANGNWSSLIFIGVENDVNKKFDIMAVLADKEAQGVFNDYLIQAKGEKAWPGLENLPNGAVEYDRITVTRK